MQDFNGQSPRQYDTPFFVVWNDLDVRKLTDHIDAENVQFNVIDWGEDKHGNPLCRVGIENQNNSRYPKRVLTVCCRKAHMRDMVDAELSVRKTA